MPVYTKVDLLKMIIDICGNFVPEEITVEIFYTQVTDEDDEPASCALLLDEEDPTKYIILIDEENSYESIPTIIASQVSLILSHLEGEDPSEEDENPVWRKYMDMITSAWEVKLADSAHLELQDDDDIEDYSIN